MYKYKHLRILAYYSLVLGIIGLAVYQFQPTTVPEPALALAANQNNYQPSTSQSANELLSSFEQANLINQEVQSLAARRQSEVLKGGAEWIHVTELHQRNKDVTGMLSTGQQIPANYVLDTWYHLDKQGKVFELINIMKAENNEIIQVSTYSKGVWQNLTVGEKWHGDSPTLNLDYGFSSDIANAPAWGSILNREENKLSNGRSALVFTIKDVFDQPVKIEGYGKLIMSGETRAQFDSQSGALLSLDRVFVDENGDQFVAEQMEILAFEKIDLPPQDVLGYLEGVTK